MKCRSCGDVGEISNAEIRWPSGQVKPKRFKKCRSALRRTLSLTMILIFVLIVLLALTDRLPLDVRLPKAENIGSNLSTMNDHGKMPMSATPKSRARERALRRRNNANPQVSDGETQRGATDSPRATVSGSRRDRRT